MNCVWHRKYTLCQKLKKFGGCNGSTKKGSFGEIEDIGL